MSDSDSDDSGYKLHVTTDVEWIAAYSITSLLAAVILFVYFWLILGNFISMHRFYSKLGKPSKSIMFLVLFTLAASITVCVVCGIDLSNYVWTSHTGLSCHDDYVLFFILFIASRYAHYMFLLLRTRNGFEWTKFGITQKRQVIFGIFAHIAVIFYIVTVIAVYESSTTKKAYADSDTTYYLCTLASKGNDEMFAGIGIVFAVFDVSCLTILLLDFNSRVKDVLELGLREEEIKFLRGIYRRHLFVLFSTLVGGAFLLIGNFVYDDTDAFNFFELIPLYYIFTSLVFLLSFEYRSVKVSLLWPIYVFGCAKIPDKMLSLSDGEISPKRPGTGLLTGAEIPAGAAKNEVEEEEMYELADTDRVDETNPLI